MGVIYKITSPSGRVYIGKTKDLKDRLRKYRTGWTTNQRLLHNSILKYGWVNHSFDVLCEVSDDELNQKEIEYIAFFQTFYRENKKGMNLTRGGEGMFGLKHSDKTKKRLSDKACLRTHTEETKKRIGQSGRGKVVSIETRKKIGNMQRGELNHMYGKGIPVLVYTKSGDFVSEFNSAKNAALFIGCFRTSITAVCRGREKSIKGFICKYKDETSAKIAV